MEHLNFIKNLVKNRVFCVFHRDFVISAIFSKVIQMIQWIPMGYIWYPSSTRPYKQCLRVRTYMEHLNSPKNLVKNRVFWVFNREFLHFCKFLRPVLVVL